MLGFVIGAMVGLAARTLWDQYRTGSLVKPDSTTYEPDSTEYVGPEGALERVCPQCLAGWSDPDADCDNPGHTVDDDLTFLSFRSIREQEQGE